MNSDDVIPVVVMSSIIALLLAAGWGIAVYRCEARWDRSGMDSEFKLFAGCLVNTESGWVPDDRMRDIR